jgi:hypothetical protein
MSPFKDRLKALLPPRLLNMLRWFYSPAYRRYRRARGLEPELHAVSTALVSSIQPPKVLMGPFVGLRYVTDAVGSAFPPKLLGTYEKELHTEIESLIASAPATVIDIGAAEGYYAVGLATRLPQAQVIAFEMDPKGRELLHQMADLNAIRSRLTVHGLCTIDSLRSVLSSATPPIWLICDAEGAEAELLDPVQIPALHHVRLLIELHPWERPDLLNLLESRFHRASSRRLITSRKRTVADFPPGVPINATSRQKHAAVQEFRGSTMQWMLIDP